jgi:hypothetical protein
MGNIVALVSHEEVEERTAASLLLAAYWAFQREDNDLDRYHWLNDTAYLDVGDVEAIARAVWVCQPGRRSPSRRPPRVRRR